ncbi:MAG: hypothetical protein HRT93_06010 [Piscirickettsiaceae bacterium]|nr:hypothetical protein [Piscirickettsiaceae bacterium]
MKKFTLLVVLMSFGEVANAALSPTASTFDSGFALISGGIVIAAIGAKKLSTRFKNKK